MTPVKSAITGDAQRTTVGDCFRACLASILDLPLEKVPHFMEGLAPAEPMNENILNLWLAARKLHLIHQPIPVLDFERAAQVASRGRPSVHYILMGQSIKGVEHSVVCRGSVMVHDPGTPALGLYGPQGYGMFTAVFIGLVL